MSSNNHKRIIEGFEEDFYEIVEKFASFCPQLELSKFLEFWNNEHLDCLFANRYDPRELVEAITHMNESLVDKLTNLVAEDTSRIVALYFIFCLYSKQPPHIQRKVRLTCQDAVTVQNLVDSNDEVGYRNARFVWNQIKAKRILRLVEERNIYGPSMLKKQDLHANLTDDQSNTSNPHVDTIEFLNNHITPQLTEVESMLATYQELKAKLKLEEISDPTVEINSSGSLTEFINQTKDMLTNSSCSTFSS